MSTYRKSVQRRREKRQAEARARQAARDARSNQDQLNRLIARGHGHCAEAQALRP